MVHSSCYGRDNCKKGVDFICQNSKKGNKYWTIKQVNAKYIINPWSKIKTQ